MTLASPSLGTSEASPGGVREERAAPQSHAAQQLGRQQAYTVTDPSA